MNKLLKETKTFTTLERQLQRRDIQIFTHNLSKLIEAAQPVPAESEQEQPPSDSPHALKP